MYAYLISSSLLKRFYGNYTEYEIVSFDKDGRILSIYMHIENVPKDI